MRKIDLTGEKYGKLTVLAPAPGTRTTWLCRCDCGREVEVEGVRLRTGNTKSCGCYRDDVRRRIATMRPGTRFGRLTVLSMADSQQGRASWLCLCDCGQELIVLGGSLRSGNTKSCGCFKRDEMAARMSLPPGHSGRNAALFLIKRNAHVRHIPWTISDEQAWALMESPCFYCGIVGFNKRKAHKQYYQYNGIDRVDNAKGYEQGNVVACCGQCNSAKSTMTIKEFLAWVTRVYHYSKKKTQSSSVIAQGHQEEFWRLLG